MKKFKIKTYSVSLTTNEMNIHLWESTDKKGSTAFYRDDEDFKILLISANYTTEQINNLLSSAFIDTLFKNTTSLNLINGVFSLFICSKKNNTVLIVTDRLGIQPVYYNANTTQDNITVFSPAVSLISEKTGFPLSINPLGLFAHIGFGYHVPPFPFLYEHIKKMPPASVIYFKDTEINKPIQYWQLTSSTHVELTEPVIKETIKAIDEDIHTVPNRNYFVGLTSGKDSLVLSSFFQTNDKVHSGSFGLANSSDVLQGKRIAEELGFQHTTITLTDIEEFEHYANHISFYSSGMATLSYVDMIKMCSSISLPNQVFVMGEGGECVREFFASKNEDNTNPLHNYITPYQAIEKIFKSPLADMIKEYPDVLLKDTQPVNSEEDLIKFYRSVRMSGNFSLRSSILFPLTDKCTPFLNNNFIDLTYNLNIKYYSHSYLHRIILSEQKKSLLHYFDNPDNTNTDCQEWGNRFKGELGEKIISLISRHGKSIETYINIEALTEVCKNNIENSGRGIFMILRILSLILFMDKTSKPNYYSSILNSTIQHYL